jgi:NADPH:quinone reductase-like Zn-dependent oxidoreductase
MKEGPTHTVNYKTQDFSKESATITNGKGVNLIVDFVGKSHWEKNIASLGIDGRMILLSTLSGMYPRRLSA